jgi:hypothetical protein
MLRDVTRSVCESPMDVRTNRAKGLNDGRGQVRRAEKMELHNIVAKIRAELSYVGRIAELQKRIRGNRRARSRNGLACDKACWNVYESSRCSAAEV